MIMVIVMHAIQHAKHALVQRRQIVSPVSQVYYCSRIDVLVRVTMDIIWKLVFALNVYILAPNVYHV